MHYTTYTCPICGNKMTALGTRPWLCVVCGKIDCNNCSPSGICPDCKQLVTREEKDYLRSMYESGYGLINGVPCAIGEGQKAGCFCCMALFGIFLAVVGLLFFFHLGFLLLTGGIILAVIGSKNYSPMAAKNEKFLEPLRQFWNKLLPDLKQRLAQKDRASAAESIPSIKGWTVEKSLTSRSTAKETMEKHLEPTAQEKPQKPVKCALCGIALKAKRCSACGMAWCSNCGTWNAADAERCSKCQFMLPP